MQKLISFGQNSNQWKREHCNSIVKSGFHINRHANWNFHKSDFRDEGTSNTMWILKKYFEFKSKPRELRISKVYFRIEIIIESSSVQLESWQTVTGSKFSTNNQIRISADNHFCVFLSIGRNNYLVWNKGRYKLCESNE